MPSILGWTNPPNVIVSGYEIGYDAKKLLTFWLIAKMLKSIVQ